MTWTVHQISPKNQFYKKYGYFWATIPTGSTKINYWSDSNFCPCAVADCVLCLLFILFHFIYQIPWLHLFLTCLMCWMSKVFGLTFALKTLVKIRFSSRLSELLDFKGLFFLFSPVTSACSALVLVGYINGNISEGIPLFF